MAGFANETVYGNNADFSIAGSNKGQAANGLQTNGQFWIGTTALNAGGTHINVGSITSPTGSVSIGYSSPNITLDVIPSVGAVGLGISYSAGIFTVVSEDGTALSPTNFGTITLPNNTTAGQSVTLQITTPYTFTDGGSTNELGANRFGITAGVAWANACPFYLYAVANNSSPQNDIAFGISRVPNLRTSPASANLAIASETTATTQGSMFLLKKNGSSVTKGNFASQPCRCVGSFRMVANTTPAWTVQSLSISGDGINNFNQQTTFTYPKAQNGATVTHFVQDANAPTWTNTTAYTYMINELGIIEIFMLYTNLTGNGSTAVLYKPTTPLNSPTSYNQFVGWYATSAVNPNFLACSWTSPNNFFELKTNAGATSLREQDVAGISASAQFGMNFTYQL